MSLLPTKPIESATIIFDELSGGSHDNCKYEINFYFDLDNFHVTEREDALLKLRRKIIDLYSFVSAEVPTQVRFDFEMENYKTKEKIVFEKEEEERLTSLEDEY